MRSFRPALLLFLCLPVSASFAAQQSVSTTAPAPTTSDPQAVAAVQGALTALVGSANLSDVTLTGTANRIAGSDNESGTATLEAMAGGYSLLSLSLPLGPRSETRNPAGTPLPGVLPPGIPAAVAQAAQPVGAWSGPDGNTHGMANHNIMTDATWFFPALTIATFASSQSYILSYIGQETHDGQPTVHLSVSRPFPQAPAQIATLVQHLSQMDLYLDPGTLLPVALAFNVHPDNNAGLDIPAEIQFSNYQAVSGVLVPSHVQKYLNNSLVLDLQFSNVTLNSGLTAAAFQLQ